MKDSSIISVLCHMRLEAIRGDQAGLAEIETLMRLRGFDPCNQIVRQHRPRVFKRGELRRVILAALRDGPKTGPEVVAYVGKAKSVNHKGLRMSVHVALSGGKIRGSWCKNGDNWAIA